jgi:hypothetical protein
VQQQSYKPLIIIGFAIIILEISWVVFAFTYAFIKDYHLTKNNLKFYQKIADDNQLLIEKKINENLALQQAMAQKDAEVNTAFSQLGTLKDTINMIVKLRNFDPELLKKYSKVYFLNENYVPKNLMPIDPQYVSNSKD